MSYEVGKDYPLTVGKRSVHYKISPKHRVASPAENISVWQVNHEDEIKCFIGSITEGYIVDNHAWGVLFKPPLSILGEGKFSNVITELVMAKFVDGNNDDKWHGYPCYYKRIGDTPPKSVLTAWVDKKIITKSQMSKISQRQVCNL